MTCFTFKNFNFIVDKFQCQLGLHELTILERIFFGKALASLETGKSNRVRGVSDTVNALAFGFESIQLSPKISHSPIISIASLATSLAISLQFCIVSISASCS